MTEKDFRFNENFRRHYKVPENYFESLESKMQGRITKNPKRMILWRRRILQAVAVLIVGLVAWPVYRQLHNDPLHTGTYVNDSVPAQVNVSAQQDKDETEIDLSDIPDEVIDEYLLTDDDDVFLTEN